MTFNLISSSHGILNGKPVIKGSRISVEMILEWIATGGTIEGIYQKNQHLPPGSVEQALQYAAQFLRNEILIEEEIHD